MHLFFLRNVLANYVYTQKIKVIAISLMLKMIKQNLRSLASKRNYNKILN